MPWLLFAKGLGWVLTLVPVVVFLTISFKMFQGAAKDDEMIKIFVILGGTIFSIGVIILVLSYLTNFGVAVLK